jgi:hypothetical protein
MATPGVYRATYKDKKTGEVREGETWFATYWDPTLKKTRKEYGFNSAGEAMQWRHDRLSSDSRLVVGTSATTITLNDAVKYVTEDYEIHARRTTAKITGIAAHLGNLSVLVASCATSTKAPSTDTSCGCAARSWPQRRSTELSPS